MELWAGHDCAAGIAGTKGEHFDACRQRYQGFFGAAQGQLDGGFALEDADCGYLLLNELVYGDETAKLARFPIRGLQAVRR